ncbi:hypothetical protein FHL15_001331 [Xylaria flabelliformis]|uniref:Uncharacterized protein n=1 Tax=Xylaria flabelliformis TaxID=2512241 RepID=A0A553IBJ8_9PEZI|nr:hypothetical protein FHL15_001331 [Xylaria flabelliformis]
MVLGRTVKLPMRSRSLGLLEDEHVNDGMNETVPCFMYIFKRRGSRHRVKLVFKSIDTHMVLGVWFATSDTPMIRVVMSMSEMPRLYMICSRVGVTADVLGNDNKLPFTPYDLEVMIWIPYFRISAQMTSDDKSLPAQ